MVDIPKINLDEKNESNEEKVESGTKSIYIPKLGNDSDSVNKDSNDLRKAKKKRNKMGFSKRKKKIIAIVGGFILILLIISLIMGLLFFRVYKKGLVLKGDTEKLLAAVNEQDIGKIKGELVNTNNSLNEFTSTYKSIVWAKPIPYFGGFVSDGEHGLKAAQYGLEAADIFIETIEPYSDILGFNGTQQAESGEETAQERLDFVVQSIPDIIPKAGELAEKLQKIQEEISQIDPNRYPESFSGYQIKSNVQKGVDMVSMGAELVVQGKPLLEAAPYILGSEEDRTYLVLFQNDKELRPTGGFMTAYSISKVDRGKFEPVSSSDIYNLDNLYTPNQKAPEPIIKYLKGPYLISKNIRLRDSNWSPDFYESMKFFSEEAESVGITDIDGIIAVDTQLLVYILDALGPIGVPGYGEFSTNIIPECDCPQVIYELESFADVEGPIVWSENEPGKIVFAPENYDNRKKIIGPLMNSILSNALGQSKEKLPALFEAGFKSLMEKHVLFYMNDEDAQKAVESFGIAGRIENYNGDYLHINDANLGGRKSNLYVIQEVNQEINVAKNGSVEKTLTITYKNTKEYDGWLNSVLPNYVRIYVPKGSELISFDGVEDTKDPYEELDKTVFAGFFELRPLGVSVVTVKYKLPFNVSDEYKLLIQKQPGTDMPLYSIGIGKQEEELFLKTDKEFKFKI